MMHSLKHPIYLILLIFLFTIKNTYAEEKIDFQVSGVQKPLLSNVEKRLEIMKSKLNNSITFKEMQHISKTGEEEISRGLEPFGYFKPSIHSKWFHQKNVWIIKYSIQLGQPIILNKININISGSGKNDKVIQKFIREFPLQPGQVFSVDNYNQAKEDFFTLLNNRGYIKSKIDKNQILIDLKKYHVTIVLDIQTHIRYKFGDVIFNQSPYSDIFLNKFVDFTSNDYFSSARLNDLQQTIMDSDYFQSAELTPDLEHITDDRIPINFILTPPKAKRFNLGIGYGTLTGPRLTAGASFRRLTNSGHHLDTQLRLSSILSGIGAKYYIPGNYPLTDLWVYGVNYQYFKPKNGISTSATLMAGYLTQISRWKFNSNLNYINESYKIIDELPEIRHLLYPSFGGSYLKTDDIINTKHGFLFNFNIRGATDQIFSSTNFLQSEIKVKYLFSVFSNSHIILKSDFGYTIAEDIKDLPLSLRFFAGGMNSIRGYKDSSIGPGKYLRIGSVEVQQKVYDNWAAAIFYDAGTAGNHWQSPLYQGAGVGIIYHSIIGPIKVYLAKGLDKTNPSYSLDFSIGPEF